MKNAIIYVHGKGGSAKEVEQYREVCLGFDVIGVDYNDYFPWIAVPKIIEAYDSAHRNYDNIYLIANSIGAYFSMLALKGRPIEKAFFISPIVDMEALITGMMHRMNITEELLKEKGEVLDDSGEVISLDYLSYARDNPIIWNTPTEILYAENDFLTPRKIVDKFAAKHGAGITVMQNGEHWFHTKEQLEFLHDWLKCNL